MLFSYIVGHVPVTFRRKKFKNEKVIKKSTGFFTHPLYYRKYVLHTYQEQGVPTMQIFCVIDMADI